MVSFPMLLVIGCAGIAANEVFQAVRDHRYKQLTGRSFGSDYGKYHRSYFEMVNYYKHAEPHRLDTSHFPVRKWRETKGFLFGYDGKRLVSIPSASESNIAVFGPPGTGKTSGLAIPNAMKFEGSVLAIDIKGDIYRYVHEHTNRKILRFCPDDPEALTVSCHFNPLEGIHEMNETERKLFLSEMALILIPDDGGNESNYFTVRARRFFQGITHLLLFENPEISFPEIIHAILTGLPMSWVKRGNEGGCQEAKEFLASFQGNNEKNIAGAYDNLCTALMPFSNPVLDELLGTNGKSLSITDLEDGKDIYLQIAQEHLGSYAPLFTLLLQTFSRAFMKRPDSSTGAENRAILMLLDEFPALTYSYDMISSNLSTLRSKSVVIVLIQQNYAQLEKRFQEAGTRSLIGNCNYQVILGSNDIGSSRTFSEMFGKKRVLRVSTTLTNARSKSTGRQADETEENVFSPSDFGDLPSKGEAIVYFKGKYCRIKKLNCYQTEGRDVKRKEKS